MTCSVQHPQPEGSPIRQPEVHSADYGSIECFREGPIAWRLNFGPDMTLDDKLRVIEGHCSTSLLPYAAHIKRRTTIEHAEPAERLA
jgi:hypothetical protein